MIRSEKWAFFAVFIVFSVTAAAAPPPVKPKYGPEATVLSLSHEFFRRATSPDFWALIPYYAAQIDDSACSVASLSMAINAARAGQKLGSEDELVTQKALAEKVKNPLWHKGNFAVSLDQLGDVAREAFAAYGVKVASIEVVHMDDPKSAATRAKLHSALVENEKSPRDLILLNFDQKVFTGDTSVGHISPVGAYDAVKKRVLVMDPDRKWYEPYWVSEETLMNGMATRDSTSEKNRGYVWIRLSTER